MKKETIEVNRVWLENLVALAEKAEGSADIMTGLYSPTKTASLIGYAKSAKGLTN